MQCPKCQHVQPDGLAECRHCGVIFSRIPRDGDSAPRASVDHGRPASSIPPAVPGGIGLLLLLAFGWWLNFPSSSAPLPGAYIDKEKQFSFVHPDDWLMLNPANYRALTTEYAGRFPRHLQQFLSNPGFAVGFVKIQDKEGQLAPSINVIAMPLKRPLPPLTESEKDEATKVITAEIGRQIDSYKLLSSEIVRVDKQAALQLTSTASIRMVLTPRTAIMSDLTAFNTRHVVGYTDEVARDIEFKSIQTLLPGRDWAYILSCSHELADSLSAESVCRTAQETFRVGKRPPRFGPIVMGSLNGFLIGAAGYLLYFLMGRAWRLDA